MPIGFLWQTLLENPLINFIIALSRVCFGSYGMAILLFTLITRGVTFPLTLGTLKSMRKLQEINPQLQDLQKRYTDPKRRSEETMKLYKEAGVNPLGCLGPQLIQIPIFIALYATIRITLGNTPESMLALASRLYQVSFIRHAVPLDTNFFGMDLAENGKIPLAVVVFASMWLQQRISSSRSSAAAGGQQAQMNQMMQWFFPIFFGYFFVLSLPSALGLYWGVSTVIGIVLQWVFVGPGDFKWSSLIPQPSQLRSVLGLSTPATQVSGAALGGVTDSGVNDAHASGGSERQNGRRSRGTGPGTAGPPPRTSRRRRYPRR